METQNANASLYAKMALVMGELSSFNKDGQFNGGKVRFKYAGAEQVFDKIRGLMAKHKLAIVPAIVSHDTDTDGMMTVNFRYTLLDGDTGATLSTEWTTMVMRYGNDDKIINKAATVGLKYFLMTTFVVSAGDNDEDSTAPTESAEPYRKPQPTPAPTPRGKSPFATPSPDDANDSGSDVVESVKTEMTKTGKLRIVAAGASAISRQVFTDAGIDTDDWATPGEHPIGRAVRVFWARDNGYKNILRVEVVSSIEEAIPF